MDKDISFIHIDEILSASFYQWFVWGSFLGLILLIITLLSLPVSYKLALCILCVLCVWLQKISCHQVTAISSSSSYHSKNIDDLTWHLTMIQGYFFNQSYHSEQPICQARLTNIHVLGCTMFLTFDIFEPLSYQRIITIWQDQCSDDMWRQLNVLSNYH